MNTEIENCECPFPKFVVRDGIHMCRACELPDHYKNGVVSDWSDSDEEDEDQGPWCCFTCGKYFQEKECYFENARVYCMSCVPEDSDEEDEDAEFGKPNRGYCCVACSERIVGKYEFTGGQYAENGDPLCRDCWDRPQHDCFNSCYKNPYGVWWCQDQDEFTNRTCGYCDTSFDLKDPHYYDEEGGDCYCNEDCFKQTVE